MSDDIFNLLMEGSHFETVRENFIKPPFAWAGAKNRSLQELLPHLPYRKSWIDVFGGSGCVTLARRPSKLEVFNDAYSGITDFYNCIKDPVLLPQLIEWLQITIHSRELFIKYKRDWKNAGDVVERAAKWYYMLSNSFGNLGRNFGRHTKNFSNFSRKLPNSLENFWPVHHRMQDVQIENMDFEQILKDYDHHEAVFYVDPPYLHSDVGIYEEAWNLEKHKRLLQVIFEVEGFVALSGYDNELYNSMPWTDKHSWKTQISISSNAETGTNNLEGKASMMSKEAIECLWIKEVK